MLLRARLLNNVTTVNSFVPVENLDYTAGSNFNVYFQLVDKTQLPSTQGWNPAGNRYCPQAGSTLVITLAAVDAAYALTRYAVQPFPCGDASIWMLTFLPTDFPNGGCFSWSMVLTEPGPPPTITNGTAGFALHIYPAAPPPNW